MLLGSLSPLFCRAIGHGSAMAPAHWGGREWRQHCCVRIRAAAHAGPPLALLAAASIAVWVVPRKVMRRGKLYHRCWLCPLAASIATTVNGEQARSAPAERGGGARGGGQSHTQRTRTGTCTYIYKNSRVPCACYKRPMWAYGPCTLSGPGAWCLNMVLQGSYLFRRGTTSRKKHLASGHRPKPPQHLTSACANWHHSP